MNNKLKDFTTSICIVMSCALCVAVMWGCFMLWTQCVRKAARTKENEWAMVKIEARVQVLEARAEAAEALIRSDFSNCVGFMQEQAAFDSNITVLVRSVVK